MGRGACPGRDVMLIMVLAAAALGTRNGAGFGWKQPTGVRPTVDVQIVDSLTRKKEQNDERKRQRH